MALPDPQRFAALLIATVKTAVSGLKSEVVDLSTRMAALEARDLVPGPIGPPGEKGLDGKDGERGPMGEKGLDGLQGERGEPGIPGAIGEKGMPGERGVDGPIGQPGRDGQPGVPGREGAKGLDGTDGRDGIDGKDGFGFDDFTETFDGERTITRRYTQGDRVKDFTHHLKIPIYRGVFEDQKQYEACDLVTYAGAMWIAKEATTIKPDELGLGSKAWTLCVKRGREGKQGPNGKPGPMGPRGESGSR